MDELIGYGQISLPDQVFCGESVDEWFPLSGKQGENKEGSIHLIFTLVVSLYRKEVAFFFGLFIARKFHLWFCGFGAANFF